VLQALGAVKLGKKPKTAEEKKDHKFWNTQPVVADGAFSALLQFVSYCAADT